MEIVDLHVHSTKSDGTLTPTELVSYAIEKKLSAFALTDHDTISGIKEAMDAAKGTSLEVIPGIEFSTEYLGRDIHILGIYIDFDSSLFMNALEEFQTSRDNRNRTMCTKLQEHGVPVTYEDLIDYYPHSILTRAHYANYMLEKGYTKSTKEAFERYIGDYAPCFIPREKVTPVQAVELILSCGGIPILAHPTLYHFGTDTLDQLVLTLKSAGLVGIEAVYSTHSASEERDIKRLAIKHKLCISGGSDFHGAHKPGLDLATGYGNLFIPSTILSDLKSRTPYK